MRRALVTILLTAMLAGLAVMLVWRERVPVPAGDRDRDKAAAKADPDKDKADDSASDKAAKGKQDGSAGKAPAPAPAGKAPAADAAAAQVPPPAAERTMDLDRPLRMVAVGWDILVPGVIANGGVKPAKSSLFAEHDVQVELRAVGSFDDVESALALGGGDAKGADIAIVPLPRLVASYEDLRALRPQIFFVVGWSRGRHAVTASAQTGLTALAPRGEVTLVGDRGEAETLLSLFVLDLAGASPSRVRIVARGDSAAAGAGFAAIDRSNADPPEPQPHILLTSADASNLIPYVAIAPQGFLDEHPQAIAAWAKGWLAGAERLGKDVAGSARSVARHDGAPEPLLLLKQLGQLSFAGLTDNARAAGLSGRGAVTLETLFSRTWLLWRQAGVLTTPAPEAAPLSTAAITALVVTKKKLADTEAARKPSFDTAAVVTLAVKTKAGPDGDGELARTLGFVAGVFGGSALRVGVDRSKPRTEAAIAQASERFDLPAGRFQAAPDQSKRGKAQITVLAAP